MVKLLLLLSLILLASNAARASNWMSLNPGNSYQLKNSVLSLKTGTRLKLVEKSDLVMMKMKLHKYKINNCELPQKETNLELVAINADISVGVTLAKNCILEVFVQEKDSKTETFFI